MWQHKSKTIDIRPKWQAGDRIYLPGEREYATIKWIGSREYKFLVVIQFDKPVGDETFESDDLPFLIQRGYARKLRLEELNEVAHKASNSTVERLRSKFTTLKKWGSDIFKPIAMTHRPSVFYIESNKKH